VQFVDDFGRVPIGPVPIYYNLIAGANPVVAVLLSNFSAADPDLFVLKTSSGNLAPDISEFGFIVNAAQMHSARQAERSGFVPRSLKLYLLFNLENLLSNI